MHADPRATAGETPHQGGGGPLRIAHRSQMHLLVLAANGKWTPEVRAWLQSALAALINAGGAVPLERCLRLPMTPAKWRQLMRNYWLLNAIEASGQESLWMACVEVSDALAAFLSRGPWHAWRSLQDPPAGTPVFRSALFYVAKHNGGEPLSPRHVYRIAR